MVNILEYDGVVMCDLQGYMVVKFAGSNSPDAGDIVVLEITDPKLIARRPLISQFLVSFTNPSTEDPQPDVKFEIGVAMVVDNDGSPTLTSIPLRTVSGVAGTVYVENIPNFQSVGTIAELQDVIGSVILYISPDHDVFEFQVDIIVPIGP